MRTLLVSAVACALGCGRNDPPAAAPEAPVTAGHFLETPSGQPPVPLAAQGLQVAISAAADPAAVRAAAERRFGAGHVFAGAQPGQLVVRDAEVSRDALEALVAAGARGALLLWYPLRTVRQRLYEGGSAGLWRGILATRDLLTRGDAAPAPSGADDGLFGGTPRLHGFAVSTVDRPLLGDWTPRATRRHEDAPAILRAPGDEPVDLHTVADRLEGPDFEAAIERLVRVTNQGGDRKSVV